jgi:putative transposase
MARRPRVLVEGGVYHVYNRVASGEPVFGDPEEAIRFVEIVHEVKARDGWTVFAWCVMSNHYHLALRTSVVPLSRGLHHVQNIFSRGFNRRRGRTGSLWQSRYQAKLVDEARYLSQLVLYIHLNPVRAGVVEKPFDYGFGGHREIAKRVKAPLVDVDDALLSFGATNRAARRAYLAGIRAGCQQLDANAPAVDDGLRTIAWTDRELERRPGQEHVDILGRGTGLERRKLSAETYVETVAGLLDVSPARLASRVRDRETARLRRLIATLGVERWGQRGADLARVLGKNPDVVSWWVGEGVRRRMDDEGFARDLDDLDTGLSAHIVSQEEEGPNPGDRR